MMEFLFPILDHFVGDDTDPIDMLPLVVLVFVAFSVRHLRALLLRVLSEVGSTKERIDIMNEIRRMGDDGRP